MLRISASVFHVAAHSGHHDLRCRTLLAEASHWCPTLHSQRSFCKQCLYDLAKHLPPSAAAWARRRGKPILLHWRHHVPECRTLSGVACQEWPCLHSQVTFERLLTYFLAKHLPPRRAACACNSRMFSGAFPAQTGHQAVGLLRTAAGIARQV